MMVTLAVSLTACGDDDAPPDPMMDGDIATPDADVTMPDGTLPIPDGDPPGAATYARVSAEIFVPICSTCHHPRDMGRSPLLNEAGGYDAIVGVASRKVRSMNLVEAGDPSLSFLYHKVANTHGTVCRSAGVSDRDCGGRMPTGRPDPGMLNAEQRALINDWIAAGAPR
jgi:hypothetical protein